MLYRKQYNNGCTDFVPQLSMETTSYHTAARPATGDKKIDLSSASQICRAFCIMHIYLILSMFLIFLSSKPRWRYLFLYSISNSWYFRGEAHCPWYRVYRNEFFLCDNYFFPTEIMKVWICTIAQFFKPVITDLFRFNILSQFLLHNNCEEENLCSFFFSSLSWLWQGCHFNFWERVWI